MKKKKKKKKKKEKKKKMNKILYHRSHTSMMLGTMPIPITKYGST